jgi:hypothetical protein
MAFSPAPTGWFSGLSVSGTDITIPFASLNTLDDTKADPSTGDVREIVYNFCEAFSDKWQALASADRPEQLTVTTSTSVTSSGGEDILTKIYTIRVALTVEDVSIVSE